MDFLSKNKTTVVLVAALVILSGFVLYYFAKPQRVYWSLKQVDQSEVDVYLMGPEASKVSAAELDISFDRSNVHIASVDPGQFFANPISIKMDSNSLSYALMTNPINRSNSDTNQPVVKFHLTPDKLSGYKFSILPASQVYISGSGGFFPKVAEMVLK